METLKELVQSHVLPRRELDGGEKELVRQLEGMLSARPYRCEQEAVDNAIENLAQTYFRNRLEKRYVRLSDELFELERQVELKPEHVHIEKEKSSIQSVQSIAPATIPLLADIAYGKSCWTCEETTTAKVTYHSNRTGEVEAPFKIDVAAPPLTQAVKAAGAEAMAYAYEVCAAALRTPALRDAYRKIIIGSDAPENGLVAVVQPHLRVLWKPTEESMKIAVDTRSVRDPDPALMLYFNKDCYLVTTWDVAHEEPFRHYLAEFTAPKQQKLKLPK